MNRFLNIFNFGSIKKIDNFLLENYPHAWRTRVHVFVVYFAILLNGGVFLSLYFFSPSIDDSIHLLFGIIILIVVLFWEDYKSRYQLLEMTFSDNLSALISNSLCVFSLCSVAVTIFYFQTGSEHIFEWFLYMLIALVSCFFIVFAGRKITDWEFNFPDWLSIFSYSMIRDFFRRKTSFALIKKFDKGLLENKPSLWLLKPYEYLLELGVYILLVLFILVITYAFVWVFYVGEDLSYLLILPLSFLCFLMISVNHISPYLGAANRRKIRLPILPKFTYYRFQFFSLTMAYLGISLFSLFSYYFFMHHGIGEMLNESYRLPTENLYPIFRVIIMALLFLSFFFSIIVLPASMDFDEEERSFKRGFWAYLIITFSFVITLFLTFKFFRTPNYWSNFLSLSIGIYFVLLFTSKMLRNTSKDLLLITLIVNSLGYGLPLVFPMAVAMQGFWLDDTDFILNLPYEELLIILSTFLAVLLSWPFFRNLQSAIAIPYRS